MDVEWVDSLQQTPLHYAAAEGNVAVARLLISLGMSIDFADNRGATALDHAVVNERFEMVRLLASMGANINSVSPSRSQAMKALLKEVREREEHRENRKRKRDVESTDACPNGQKRSAIAAWTYSDTDAVEPRIHHAAVKVVHESEKFFACTCPTKSTTVATRIRRSATRPQETYSNILSV